MFAVRFSACLKLLREGACFNEDGSRFHANGPLYLKVVLPISKLNLGDIKELVFRKLYHYLVENTLVIKKNNQYKSQISKFLASKLNN